MEKLPDDTASIKTLVKALLEKVARLEAENAKLRTRLGLNSTNSHKPPSSDGYAKKTTQPGIPKADGRKNGGQTGHRGKTLTRTVYPMSWKSICQNAVVTALDRLSATKPAKSSLVGKCLTCRNQNGKSPSIASAIFTCCGIRQTGAYPGPPH